MSDIDNEREMFEKAFHGYCFDRDKGGTYWSDHVESAWDGWKARAALQPAIDDRQCTNAAVKTLQMLGYTYHGAELWKPPLGKVMPVVVPMLMDEKAAFEAAVEQAEKRGTLRDVLLDWDSENDRYGSSRTHPMFSGWRLATNPAWNPFAANTINILHSIDQYARSLAEALHRKHYRQDSPNFSLFDDTYGVMTQIDNMICGLSKHAAPPVDAQKVRDDALEEAAKICEWHPDPTRPNTTSAYALFHMDKIRALKSQPVQPAAPLSNDVEAKPNKALWDAITRLERQDSTYDERIAAADQLRVMAVITSPRLLQNTGKGIRDDARN